jgi:HPt (histidine-containing phosphotransfer) domain-containing protein
VSDDGGADPAGHDPLAAAVAALWRQVAPEQIATARRLEGAASRVEAVPDDEDAWQVVRDLAHRLAGTLGTFGQHEAGRIAVELEERVSGTSAPAPALRDDARRLATALRVRLETAG